MAIQLFVENSIKHAFPSTPGKDKIEVSIETKNKVIEISIEDNGIGRKKAITNKNTQQSTGIGLKVIQQLIVLLNKQNTNKIEFSITDLYHKKIPSGTLVKVSIPEKFNYSVR